MFLKEGDDMDKNENNKKQSLNNERGFMVLVERFHVSFMISMIFMLLLLINIGMASADFVIDNGNPGTSYTGKWAISKGTMPYGANSLSSQNGATYTWKFTSQTPGPYEVFMWWSGYSSRATTITVRIVSKDGVKTLNINQKLNTGKWNSLGKYNFNSTATITIVAARGIESTCADAVKITPLNMPPTAYIDSITPNPGLAGQSMQFTGHGTDAEGSVAKYLWESSINGRISSAQSFSTMLSKGDHIITLTVYDNNGTASAPVSQTLSVGGPKLESDLQLTGFPHQIDIYSTSIANKAVIFLHGGGGTKEYIASDLGLVTLVGDPPTSATINWDWINTNKILVALPQGQAVSSNPTAYTWSNHVMDSGVDDMAFLQALATYIKAQYGISDIYLAGHSNGGMMANRIWCEAPENFKAYISLSGPASSYYLAPSTPCTPSTVKPYYGIVGGQDTELRVAGNWDQSMWLMDPTYAYLPAFVNIALIGEWTQQVMTRGPLMCNEVPRLADGVTVNGVETWNNCNGNLKLQEVLNGDHDIPALEAASGQKMRDLIMSFINQLQ
jgi:polyhydroxybutyrate depolymerase